MAQDDGADGVGGNLELLEKGKDKDGSLAHAGLGLADHIHTEDRLKIKIKKGSGMKKIFNISFAGETCKRLFGISIT